MPTPEKNFENALDQALDPTLQWARAQGISMALEDFMGKIAIITLAAAGLSWWLIQKQDWPIQICWLNVILFIGCNIWMFMIPRQKRKEYAEYDKRKNDHN